MASKMAASADSGKPKFTVAAPPVTAKTHRSAAACEATPEVAASLHVDAGVDFATGTDL